MSFKNYTDCLLHAFQAHPKSAEVVKRKQEILTNFANKYKVSLEEAKAK